MPWKIDDQSVTEDAYKAFLAGLTVVPGTWYYDDGEVGGATGFTARHRDGTEYQVVNDSSEGHSITRSPALR